MRLRVLLIQPDPEDALFFNEVLAEIEAAQPWGAWVPVETLYAAAWSDAAAILASEPVGVILLDTAHPAGVETFRQIQAQAPDVPVVLLTAAQDAALRLVREGAQDFVLKKDADSPALAHALCNAVERHRVLAAARAASAIDPLTGLANRAAFLTYAERDRKLAERLKRRWMLLLAEPRNLAELTAAFGEERRGLALVEAADHLRSALSPTDLVARFGDSRFTIGIFDSDTHSIESAWARMQERTFQHRIGLGAAIFDPTCPVTLDALLEQAELDLAPPVPAVRR